jgi:hypothetical protein
MARAGAQRGDILVGAALLYGDAEFITWVSQ